jgi:hypothetical protein
MTAVMVPPLLNRNGLRLSITRRLTPTQPISPERRPYSIFGQRFITTFNPPSSAIFAASSLRTPSCIHITLAPMAMASRAISGAASGLRNMSTTSTGSSMSESEAKIFCPSSSLPACVGLTGMTR